MQAAIRQGHPGRAWRGIEHGATTFVVLALHLLFAAWLLRSPAVPRVAAHVESGMRLVLLPRPHGSSLRSPSVPALKSNPPMATRQSQPRLVDIGPSSPASGASAGTATPDDSRLHGAQGGAPLDLSLPADMAAPVTIAKPNAMKHAAPVQFSATRFNSAWAPDGGDIQQTWAFHSPLAAVLLGATGALDKPCTELERRHLLPRCAGAQYQGDTAPPPAPGR